jgi:hypothetical protein
MEKLRRHEQKRTKRSKLAAIRGGFLALALSANACSSANTEGIEACGAGEGRYEVDWSQNYNPSKVESFANPDNVIALLQSEGDNVSIDIRRQLHEDSWYALGRTNTKEGEDLACLAEDGTVRFNATGALLKAEAERLASEQ